MDNVPEIDAIYRTFMANLDAHLPDGLTQVDIDILNELDLITFYQKSELSFTRYFQVVETDEKITLINDQFIVWIVPEKVEDISSTFVFIALNKDIPHLELAFSVSGVYNTSKLVLRLLEHYLQDIQENEEALGHIKT